MPTLTRPGVYVDETQFPSFAPSTIGSAVAAFVGIMPRGPLTPTVVNSWQDFTAVYGGFETAYPPSAVALGVYSYFSAGGTSAVVIRETNLTPGSQPTSSSATFNDADVPPTATLQISADNPGVWSHNNIYIEIVPGTVLVAGVPQTFTIQVKYQGTQPVNLVERWENLTMIPGSLFQGSNNYAIDVVNSPYTGSNYIFLTDLMAAVGNTNLLNTQASSFEDGVSTQGWAAGTNTTLSNVGGIPTPPQGSYVMGMAATTAAAMSATTPVGTNGIPVLPGKSYTASCSFRASTTGHVATTCNIGLYWYDTTGTQIGTLVNSTVVPDTTTSWTAATVSGAAPSNAAYAAIQLSVVATNAGDVHYVDNILLMGQNPNNNPVPTTGPVPLVGGIDGAGPDFTSTQKNIALLDQFPDRAFVLNLPGDTTPNDVANAITYAQNRGDIFVVVDCPPAQTPQQMALFGNSIASSPYAAVYYPQLLISDPYSPTAGRTRLVAPGGYVTGAFIFTDRQRGVQKAPAGLGTTLPGVVGLERQLTNNDLSTLTQASVNPIVSVPNSGIVIWGARTMSDLLTTRYVSVTRTVIFLQTNFIAMTKFAVFEPNDYVLWSVVTSVLNQFLTSFWQSGGLAGNSAGQAFYIICDETNNTPASIQQGIVNVQVGVALQRPAEYIVIQIGQWAGGQNVTILPG